jgi:hypothetical protein
MVFVVRGDAIQVCFRYGYPRVTQSLDDLPDVRGASDGLCYIEVGCMSAALIVAVKDPRLIRYSIPPLR